MHALDAHPDNDLFVIRNIGNQMATASGSVAYGIHHLHTPLLLIVGHSGCGAVKAASGDYASEPANIRGELDTMQVPKGQSGIEGVLHNVHQQVRRAMSEYEEDVMSGRLVVVGAVYDFRNDMKQGQGKLNVVNINGETDPRRVSAMDLMQDPPASARATRSKASH